MKYVTKVWGQKLFSEKNYTFTGYTLQFDKICFICCVLLFNYYYCKGL